jgi:DNA-binding IclR family transcriptional regulator
LISLGGAQPRTIARKISTIIQSFASRPEQSVTEIAQFAGLPLSTTHRLVSQIAGCGLLERGEKSRYRLGALLQSACSWTRSGDYRFPIGGALEDLTTSTGHRARFGMLCGSLEVSYLERPADIRRGPCVPGSVLLPAHATAMGKAILAHLPVHVLERRIQSGPPDRTSPAAAGVDQLNRELSTIRQQGIALSRGTRHEQPAWAVAVPVFARNDWAAGALELLIPGTTSDAIRSAAPALIVAARGLSRWFAEASIRQHDLAGPLWRVDPPDPFRNSGSTYGSGAAV